MAIRTATYALIALIGTTLAQVDSDAQCNKTEVYETGCKGETDCRFPCVNETACYVQCALDADNITITSRMIPCEAGTEWDESTKACVASDSVALPNSTQSMATVTAMPTATASVPCETSGHHGSWTPWWSWRRPIEGTTMNGQWWKGWDHTSMSWPGTWNNSEAWTPGRWNHSAGSWPGRWNSSRIFWPGRMNMPWGQGRQNGHAWW